MVALLQTYQYLENSELSRRSGLPELYLATCDRAHQHPYFFQGKLTRPKVTADLLIGLLKIVHARFHTPASMLQLILRNADPIVTCNDDVLRFEAFSNCCSTYGRVDVFSGGLKGEIFRRGTTNVDFNPPMHAALLSVKETEDLTLYVGKDELQLSKGGDSIIEKKVTLPVRWLKGLVEVQAYQARMEPVLQIGRSEALRFLRSVPRASTSKTSIWVTPSGKELRLSHTPSSSGIRVMGLERLRVLENLSVYCKTLRGFRDKESGASAWELDGEDLRFTLVISPEVWRGFSGEGQTLTELLGDPGTTLLGSVKTALRWQSTIETSEIARLTGGNLEALKAALSVLGSQGLVGFDLHSGSYFHRELPFDLTFIEELHPRLSNARKLLSEGKVSLRCKDGECCELLVEGSEVMHRVIISPELSRCTCPWFSKYLGQRGPCKHLLAAQLFLDGEGAP